MTGVLLEIDDLSLAFHTDQGPTRVLDHVSLEIEPEQTLGVVGESGSGKTTVAMAAAGLLAPNAHIVSGRIAYDGVEITGASNAQMHRLRGTALSVVFQNPRSALNPLRRIGSQIADMLHAHRKISSPDARREALDLLHAVRLSDPDRQIDYYPHELSGGMCQRAMIAIAIACAPRLLIADEPTTGLDSTTQRAVMHLLRDLIRSRGMSMMLITHDLGLAAQYCDRIAVMQAGRVMETANASQLFMSPQKEYTRRLIAATPLRETKLDDIVVATGAEALPPIPGPVREPGRGDVLQVINLSRAFDGNKVVDDVSFTIKPRQSVGLVGESGSGKSTISRMIARLLDQTAGEILFEGNDIGGIGEREFHKSPFRGQIQLVFQDPTDSLNPRVTAFGAIADPIQRLAKTRGAALRERVAVLADQVGLPRKLLDRLPHQLSGGQKARVGIARAIAVQPKLLVLDEPTAALDVSVQATILILLEKLKRETGMSYLFVSHDLNVVKMMCDRTIVLRRGKIIEQADSQQLFARPEHPYTRELLAAVAHLSFATNAPAE